MPAVMCKSGVLIEFCLVLFATNKSSAGTMRPQTPSNDAALLHARSGMVLRFLVPWLGQFGWFQLLTFAGPGRRGLWLNLIWTDETRPVWSVRLLSRVFVSRLACIQTTKELHLFACWFQPAQISQPTVFFSHNKPAPASPNQPRNQPTNTPFEYSIFG